MGAGRLIILLRTLRHVKFTQLYHQIYYRLVRKTNSLGVTKPFDTHSIHFPNLVPSIRSYQGTNTFNFLNLAHAFKTVNWNFPDNGKLWTYNLNYFDYLQQGDISKEEGLDLIHDFCAQHTTHQDAYEPYPISLRAINWVKFLSRHSINEELINRQLYQDLYRLHGKLEYHILANHLFENGFGLLFGAYYFQDEKLYKTAATLIRSELKEQILPDGAHYELSPMYHQIILYRILDCYQLVSRNDWKDNELANELKETASRMLGWMTKMSFSNGELPMVNDSTENIAPSPQELIRYAQQLGIGATEIGLKESGYRTYRSGELELLIDVGQIAPSYQPGHSHADNLQILLNKKNLPYLVDTGISTYEKNERRQLERSTISHNTVTVDRKNSSEVWSGFRVGRRAKTTIVSENGTGISARHNGYRKMGITHERNISVSNDSIKVLDRMRGKSSGRSIEGHLHVHPDRKVQVVQKTIMVDGTALIEFTGNVVLHIQDYDFCIGYNSLKRAQKVIYTFTDEITFIIKN